MAPTWASPSSRPNSLPMASANPSYAAASAFSKSIGAIEGRGPPLAMIEDRDYGTATSNAFNTGEPRMHRRRMLRTVVDLRNL